MIKFNHIWFFIGLFFYANVSADLQARVWPSDEYTRLTIESNNYLKNDQTYLEREPLQSLSKKGQLLAFKHNDFWRCMDTRRDKEILEKELKKNEM